ncbi:MAG: InlB B-repeat-containing protein, partial [bacterium JZ-2024 1]
NADKACTANFSQAPPPPFTLTVTLNGQGIVTSDPAGISCPSDCSEPYNQNTLVTLTATHASGWQFNGWSGDPDCSDGQVSMNADKACTANFSQAPPSQYTLTEISSPDGIVKSYPDGIYCPPDCSETYPAGTIVKLAVWPFGGAYEAGTYFTQWTGDPDCADGVVTMNGDRTCGTMFASKPPLKQIVTVMMNGSGTVTSSPSGINCLNDCTELMNFGTVVTLTAIPEPGWQFDGWTGDSYCTSGSGTITTAYDRTCVANFSPATPAEPRIEFLAPPALSRNGRLRIFGSHFGTTPGTVKIGGVTAPLTRWTNNLIVAYVTEQMPLGDNPVQVFASGKASNIKMLHVTSPPPPDGKVKWRLEVDAQYIQHRPAVGPDGTVYVHDARGFLYAVTPGGALKWVFSTPGAHGPPSVGTDGTIYAGAGTKIFAINPDGTLKWQFTDPNTGQGITAGPTVGPDGNIYAVTEKPGLGVFALSPVGTLLWNDTNGGVGFSDVAQLGEEIVFGPAQQQLYFAFDQYGLGQFDSLFGYRMNGNQQFRVETGSLSNNLPSVQGQPAVGPNGNIWISAGLRLKMYHPSGTLQWTFFDAGTSNLKHVDVGPDNVAYVVQNLSYLYAVNPNGTEKWKYTDPGILEDPIVAPNNSLVLVGGRITYGQPGFIAAVSPSGTLAWKFTLSAEHGFLVIPSSRARFSPDSSVAYIGTSRATQSTHNDFSYLYAVQTSP